MKCRTTFLGAAIGLSLAGAALAAAPSGPTPQPARQGAPKPKVRVYTNDDLDRIHPYAGQTGGGSTPAAAPADEFEPGRRASGEKTAGEAYWRAEAARAEEQVRALEMRAAALRARIAEEEKKALERRRDVVYGRRQAHPAPARGTAPLVASLAALERRIREVRTELEERARRAGALPGWLR